MTFQSSVICATNCANLTPRHRENKIHSKFYKLVVRGIEIVVVCRLPKVQPDYQLCASGGPTDYHKIWKYVHIRKSIFDNGLPDISAGYQIIQASSPSDYQIFWSYFYPWVLSYVCNIQSSQYESTNKKWISTIFLELEINVIRAICTLCCE